MVTAGLGTVVKNPGHWSEQFWALEWKIREIPDIELYHRPTDKILTAYIMYSISVFRLIYFFYISVMFSNKIIKFHQIQLGMLKL